MYKIADLELPSLVLYGDEAEDIMTSYIDFRDAYIEYNAVFLPISTEEAKKSLKEFTKLQELKEKSDSLRKNIKESKTEVEKQKLNEELSQLEIELVKVMASIEGVEQLMDNVGVYTPEKKAEIKEAGNKLKEIVNEVIVALASCLKKEDKVTPAVTFAELKNLPKGLKYKLIMDVAIEPLNGISASFLASLERVVNLAR